MKWQSCQLEQCQELEPRRQNKNIHYYFVTWRPRAGAKIRTSGTTHTALTARQTCMHKCQIWQISFLLCRFAAIQQVVTLGIEMSKPGAGLIISALHLALSRCVGKPVMANYVVLRQITSTFLRTKMLILSQNTENLPESPHKIWRQNLPKVKRERNKRQAVSLSTL